MARFVRTSCSVRWRHHVVVAGAILGVSLMVVSAALAAAGVLDTSFGGDGKVVTDLATGYDYGDLYGDPTGRQDRRRRRCGLEQAVRDRPLQQRRDARHGFQRRRSGVRQRHLGFRLGRGLAVQADGKIIVVGDAGYGGANPKFAVVRLNGSGTLDSSFSGDGKVTTDFSAKQDGASGVAIQVDGKIVVAGGSGRYDAATPSSRSPATTVTAPSIRASAETAR